MKPLITKPQGDREMPRGYTKQPVEDTFHPEETFRVRDKDWEAVWGVGLSYEDATILKNKVVGARKSKTARVESETVPPPQWYLDAVAAGNVDHDIAPVEHLTVAPPIDAPTPVKPERANDTQLQRLRAQAVATGRTAALEAQRKHELAAARDRSGIVKPKAKPTPEPKRPVPVVSTERGDVDAAELEVDASDITDILSGAPMIPRQQDADHSRKVQGKVAPKPEAPKTPAIVARAKMLYEKTVVAPRTPWEKLHVSVQSNWRDDAVKVMREEANQAQIALVLKRQEEEALQAQYAAHPWSHPDLSAAQVRDEIIKVVGMMADARTPEMQACYDAALEREGLVDSSDGPVPATPPDEVIEPFREALRRDDPQYAKEFPGEGNPETFVIEPLDPTELIEAPGKTITMAYPAPGVVTEVEASQAKMAEPWPDNVDPKRSEPGS